VAKAPDPRALRIEAMKALYAAGWGLSRIASVLNADRSLVAYHAVPGQRERVFANNRRWRANLPPERRAEINFKTKLRECKVQDVRRQKQDQRTL